MGKKKSLLKTLFSYWLCKVYFRLDAFENASYELIATPLDASLCLENLASIHNRNSINLKIHIVDLES